MPRRAPLILALLSASHAFYAGERAPPPAACALRALSDDDPDALAELIAATRESVREDTRRAEELAKGAPEANGMHRGAFGEVVLREPPPALDAPPRRCSRRRPAPSLQLALLPTDAAASAGVGRTGSTRRACGAGSGRGRGDGAGVARGRRARRRAP